MEPLSRSRAPPHGWRYGEGISMAVPSEAAFQYQPQPLVNHMGTTAVSRPEDRCGHAGS